MKSLLLVATISFLIPHGAYAETRTCIIEESAETLTLTSVKAWKLGKEDIEKGTKRGAVALSSPRYNEEGSGTLYSDSNYVFNGRSANGNLLINFDEDGNGTLVPKKGDRPFALKNCRITQR